MKKRSHAKSLSSKSIPIQQAQAGGNPGQAGGFNQEVAKLKAENARGEVFESCNQGYKVEKKIVDFFL